ncbi:MAG: DUF58 domain-containing protein [Treponema sp.]|jgi:uncharacterized protein (DUF58 family)|nr:DUF58 domain-containing protein [Treponema sp.]
MNLNQAQSAQVPVYLYLKPGKGLFIAALLYLVLGAAAFFSQAVFLIWFLTGICLLPFIIADALVLAILTDRLKPERTLPLSLAQGEPVKVTIAISREKKPLVPRSILLYDLYPALMQCNVFPAKLDRSVLKNGGTLIFEYPLLPAERGPWEFTGLEFLLGSFLGFWQLRVTRQVTNRGRTYPDFKKLSRGQELRGVMEQRGLIEIRRRGQGLEFMGLRDYQEGDSIRSIDWNATSRNRELSGGYKVIVREYQEEQDQQVLFILDSGYRLAGSQFDSALNGVLLLSYAALKHGDSVAALTFGAADRWIPPRKGISTLTGLMNGLYDLQSSPVPSSPFSALENALAKLHRRTFIILISNFREEDGESLSWILRRIEQRHLLLLVSFRESEAEGIARRPVEKINAASPEETLETAAAFSYLASRRRLYQSWEHLGLLTLETSPEKISSALINKYLSVKRSGRL